MSEAITTLWWVSVGENICEPARIVEDSGVKLVYTIGCGDPTVWSEDCGIALVEEIGEVPLTPAEEAKRERAWRRRLAEQRNHGYRKF